MEWLTQMRTKIENGTINRKDLPSALQSLVDVNEKADPQLVMDWHKSNMEKVELNVYRNAKSLNLDPTAERYLMSLDGVRALTDAGSPDNMAIDTIPKGSLTDIFDKQPEEIPASDRYNLPKSDTSNNYIVDPVTRISEKLLNDNSIIKIIKSLI